MTTISMPSSLPLVPSLETAWQDVDSIPVRRRNGSLLLLRVRAAGIGP
jgi:hypothetical protein